MCNTNGSRDQSHGPVDGIDKHDKLPGPRHSNISSLNQTKLNNILKIA